MAGNRYNQNKKNKQNTPKSINKHSIGMGFFMALFFTPFASIGLFALLDYLFLHRFGMDDATALIVGGVFFAAGFIGITLSLRHAVRQIKAKRREKRIIANGDIVTAIISDYSYQKIVRKSASNRGTSQSHYFKVSFNYTFAKRNNESVTKSLTKDFGVLPSFCDGARISVAVNGDETVILDGYIPDSLSSRELTEIKNADYEAMFNGLDGKELTADEINYNDYTRSQTGEYRQYKKIGGIAILVFYLVVFVPIFLFLFFYMTSQLPLPIKLAVCGFLAIVTSPPLIIGIALLVSARRSKLKEQRVLSNCRFTLANLNLVTDTYTSTAAPKLKLCFIDNLANKRVYKIDYITRKLISSNRTNADLISEKTLSLVVAYSDTEAVMLRKCVYPRKSEWDITDDELLAEAKAAGYKVEYDENNDWIIKENTENNSNDDEDSQINGDT